ncbi:MAG: iron-containing alcohol dehydrogenase family protein [Burkholderiales bacterium]
MIQGDIRDWPRRVCFGPGSVRELPRLLRELGTRRALVLCGKTVAGSEMLARVRGALGEYCVGVFDGVKAHTPFEDVESATALVRQRMADMIVSVGGGSAIDTGKGVAIMLATGGDFEPYAIDFGTKGMARASLGPVPIRHIAIPTTAGSASDVMPTAGIRDPKLLKKMLFWDERLVPDATVLDPEMAVFADATLTAATGMTAMARAIECLYSKHRHPISTGLALHAARLLRTALPRSVTHPNDLDARADCQMAALMSGTASINAMVSVVHAIGHVIGPRFHLQHGVSHAMLLAPALRRLLPAIGGDARYVLEALGCAADGSVDDVAAALRALLNKLPLPQRLRDVGVKTDDIAVIAGGTMRDYMMANLAVPMSQAHVESLLLEAW